MSRPFTALPVLTRVAWRRDRVRTPAWAVGLVTIFAFTAAAWESLYPTAADRAELAGTLGASPALTALLGPLFAPLSTGGLTMWRIGTIATVVLGLVNIFLVARHSRAEEQDGRTELFLSGITGRCAPLGAAVAAAAAADVLFAALLVLALGWSLGFAGTALMALAVASGAFVFAGVAALTAQAARTSRGATSVASLVLAGCFAATATANSGSTDPGGPLVWGSPFGWVQQSRAFADDRWWVALLPLLAAAVACTAGFVVVARRDHGSGLMQPRPGRASAPGWLTSGWTMAWRLDRAALLAWSVGAAAYGLLMGLLVRSAVDLIDESPQLREFIARLGGTAVVADAYVVFLTALFGLAAAAFGISTVLRLRTDETSGRAELALSTATGRGVWAGGRVLTSMTGALVVMLAGGLAIGVSYGAGAGDVLGQAARYCGAALTVVPAVLVLVGLTVAIVGALPRATWLAWLALVWAGLVAELGEVLGLPDWVLRTTPFWYASAWPVQEVDPVALVLLTCLAASLTAFGVRSLRRRDLPA